MEQPNIGLSNKQRCRRTPKLPAFLLFIVFLVVPQGLCISFASGSQATDGCVAYDTCSVNEFFRTCSCDGDCYRYGTCCRDAPAASRMASWNEHFHCYSSLTPSPVFTKKACAEDWQGEETIRDACVGSSTNLTSDLMSHVLVSSNRTFTTYWNWNCALCNGENIPDLSFWTTQFSCPLDLTSMSLTEARQDLHFDDAIREWGITDNGRFLACPVSFYQPAFLIGRLRLCAPNMTSDCPSDWEDEDVGSKCLSHYGERRLKTSQVYFKNEHCALCNGVAANNLGCYGRLYRSSSPDSRALKIVYNLNMWSGEFSQGYASCKGEAQSYDPFLKKCRNLKCAIRDPTLGVDKCTISGCRSAKGSSALYCFVAMMSFLVHALSK